MLANRALFIAVFALLPLGVAAAAAPPADYVTVPGKADARPKDYAVGGALNLREDVSYAFSTSSGPVRLDVGRITNESTTTTSGSVRVGLLVSTASQPFGTYYVIAQYDLGQLQPNFFFASFSRTVPYLVPPDGKYYIHMGVFEYEPSFCTAPDGYCLDDWVTFANQVEVIGGQIFDAGPPPQEVTTAVEYYHAGFDHYFVTAFEGEIALLDAGRFPGWARTNQTFPVWTTNPGNRNGVCRFYSASFAPKSSHFYTPVNSECTGLLGSPHWQFEAVAFFVQLPNVNGNCVPGTQQLFRLYNNGLSGAPNHRYTTSLTVRSAMLAQGWISEGYGPLGTIACVPL